MSKASRQSISLLAVIHGCFKTIDTFNLAPELAPTILYGIEVSERCIHEFPETGDPQKNVKWMTDKIHRIDDELNRSESVYTMIVLTSLSHQIITDLSEKIRDREKLEKLEEIEEIVYSVSDMIDTKKDQFAAYEESDRILRKLYNYLEFSI